MALVSSDLADALYKSLSHTTDCKGVSKTTPMMQQYAKGYCACLQAGIVNNLAGTISATSPPSGGPITDGQASQGILVLIPSIMSAITLAGSPPGAHAMLTQENIAVLSYLMAAGRVSFASGNIQGVSSCSPLSAGTLTGKGTEGVIGELDGGACADYVLGQIGRIGSDRKPFYTALMQYTMDNASVLYPMGSVTGTFSAGGGKLTEGAATGGIIS